MLRITLSATSRGGVSSRARYTRPMPPSPSTPMMVNAPMRAGTAAVGGKAGSPIGLVV